MDTKAEPGFRGRRGVLSWFAALIVVWAFSDVSSHFYKTRGQPVLRGIGTGFRGSERDAQGRPVRIRGDRYEPYGSLSDGRFRITGMTIESPRGTNSSMIIEVAEGIFDPRTKIAFSTNTIAVRMSDQRFAIDGQGFRYGMLDSRLTISNHVRSVIRKPPSKGKAASPPPSIAPTALAKEGHAPQAGATNPAPSKTETIEIRSDQFDFLAEVAVFSGQVRARDEESDLSCGILKAFFEASGNDVQRIEASENVSFEQAGARTTADKAVYSVTQDVVTLTGKPAWKTADMEGSGELLVINSKAREFRVERDVKVKLPQQSMFPLDWQSRASPTNAPGPTNRWIVIQSENLNYRPTGALFQGNVRVVDPQGAELKCGLLTNSFSGPGGRLTGVVAEKNVEYKQGDLLVRGDKGTYQTNSDFITLTGTPTWKTKQGEGKGDVLLINPKTRQIQAEGHVAMKLAGPDLASFDLAFQKPGTNSLIRTNQEFIIVADELYYRSGSVIFLHRVSVTSPQQPEHELSCEVLAAFFAEPGNKLDQLVAEEKVQVRQGDLRAYGDKVVYWVPKGLLELTGQPRIVAPGRIYRSDRIVLNRKDSTVRFLDDYRIELDLDTIRKNTNTVRSVAAKTAAGKPESSGKPAATQ